jgi:hypothetical protein
LLKVLVLEKATSTGKLPDSLHRNDAVAELCCGKFYVAYCRDSERKLLKPPPFAHEFNFCIFQLTYTYIL